MSEIICDISRISELLKSIGSLEASFRNSDSLEDEFAVSLPWMDYYAVEPSPGSALFVTPNVLHAVLKEKYGRCGLKPISPTDIAFESFIDGIKFPEIGQGINNRIYQWGLDGLSLGFEMLMSPEGFGRLVAWKFIKQSQGVTNG